MGTTKKAQNQGQTYPRPSWLPHSFNDEEELCPDCFRVVGEKSRYKLVCILGKENDGMTVSGLTKRLKLKQPTITHHLQVLRSVGAVGSERSGREQIYQLNRGAHCFKECKIPY